MLQVGCVWFHTALREQLAVVWTKGVWNGSNGVNGGVKAKFRTLNLQARLGWGCCG
jgi:hypothetical protein